MAKTFEEINEKIKSRKAVVVTAEEMIGIVKERGAKKASEDVDVVTTGTFAPMCSSGAILNTGHSVPRMKMTHAWFNNVFAYGGIAAVDFYLGATECTKDDPLNKAFPGKFKYGGGHVIEDLVSGKDVIMEAAAYGTDCYPRKELRTLINIKDLNTAQLLNPRNCYQNYNVSVNKHTNKTIYTYMGILRPNMANAGYCSAGQLSPLLNDPHYRTIGIGTRIFLGGGTGYVYMHGTQHSPNTTRGANGVPRGGAGTIAVTGDMKGMSPEFVRGVSMTGYGVSLALGIGIPIPILDEDMARFTGVSDEEIFAPVVDYSHDYPNFEGSPLGWVSYKELRSGSINLNGKKIETFSLSSYPKARKIAEILKKRIDEGSFLLGKPVELLPGEEAGLTFNRLKLRPV
ncbi:MAG: homocysteine biosynthesis protein [Firmicutes bacterium]|nr:homocysteine biosynthesis protein [Bacillota bacterium]